ncbi:MAG: hypothetical protein ACP5IL_00620 [Syntrophobacteraceae bacterium]
MVFTTLAKRAFLLLFPVVLLFIGAMPSLSKAVENDQILARSIRRSVEMDTLNKGIKAFDAGAYEVAKTNFEMLSNVAENADIRREALFGLASTRLIQASDKEQFDRAVATWQKWAAQTGSPKGIEDPRMLTPFFLKLRSAIDRGEGGPLGAKNNAPPQIVIMRQKVVQALRAKLELAERQVRKLRQDLKSLDEIHRKYEEKKQEMAP